MATLPNPRTWTVGELLTAAKLNTDARDGLNFLLAPPMFLTYKTADQSLANNTLLALTWDSEQYDNDGGHSNSSNNSRYIAQTAGWFDITGGIIFATNATGYRMGEIRKNGSTTPSIGRVTLKPSGLQSDVITINSRVNMSVGDYVELWIFQSSGGALAQWFNDGANSFFAAKWSCKL